jgi:hypothetical protein
MCQYIGLYSDGNSDFFDYFQEKTLQASTKNKMFTYQSKIFYRKGLVVLITIQMVTLIFYNIEEKN